MENPERATFYFYEGSEDNCIRDDTSNKEDNIRIGDQVKIYIKPYNLISNYSAIVKEIVSNIAIVEVTTRMKKELVKISLKDHIIKKNKLLFNSNNDITQRKTT
jgi:translation initiation factor IF-1